MMIVANLPIPQFMYYYDETEEKLEKVLNAVTETLKKKKYVVLVEQVGNMALVVWFKEGWTDKFSRAIREAEQIQATGKKQKGFENN